MIEEDSEDIGAPTEALAQYIHENKRLKDELASFKMDTFGIEESLNILSVDIKKKDSCLKRSEQRLTSMLQAIQEKDNLISVMERKLGQTMDENKNLMANITLLKDENDKLEVENEVLRKKEKDLMEKQSEIETKHFEYRSKIDCLNKENASIIDMLDDLRRQVKVLEDEKMTFQDKIEVLTKTSQNCWTPSPLSPSSFSSGRHCLSFSPEENNNVYVLDNEVSQLNLREELLLGEINEKQNKINSLEEKLLSSENTLLQISDLIRERLKEAIDVILISWNNANEDFEIIFPPLKPFFEDLMDKLRTWLDGQSGENNPLTEAPDSVKVKEAVINAQPVPNRTVESISIATQTDRILLAKALEEFNPLQNVLDHKYSDVDMDLYRSYRKLSILPEEEDDETFRRIPSLKKAINSKSFGAKLPQSYKTHSADDILSFENRIGEIPSCQKLISSCTNIILSGREGILNDSVDQTEFFQGSPETGKQSGSEFAIICDNKLSDNCNSKSEQKSIGYSKDTPVVSLDPVEVLRQPHSFDSYLDPQQIQITALPRQISDPTQNTVCDLPLTRRGSYLKRPRSTCRPLRLPCEENDTRQEERVSKVRFDLSNNANSKSGDNTNGLKGPIPASSLKNSKKIERISRFTVERVDEDEFRKSIDESGKIANHKRPPLIHSVVYKKSVFHEMTVHDCGIKSVLSDDLTSRISVTGSPESPSYETATENSPADSFDTTSYESNYLIADIYPCKRRKQSDSSSYSMESQESIDGNDILLKSIKLHSNSEHITMKELDRESSTSSHLSMEMDIPYIDAEELPVVKPSPEIIGTKETVDDYQKVENRDDGEKAGSFLESGQLKIDSPIKQSDSSETFETAYSDVTPTTDVMEGGLSPPKSSGLSKSPTVLKNLANFELYNTVSESFIGKNQNRKVDTLVRNQIVEEEDEGSDINDVGEGVKKEQDEPDDEEEESTILRLTSCDESEISDTVTYVTVKSDPSNLMLSSDCESDTYVTIQSDKSTLERKFSDFSENSSSPYNTPPDTSSASFCTPPDTYSPILTHLSKHFGASFEVAALRRQTASSPLQEALDHTARSNRTEYTLNTQLKYETSPDMSPFRSQPCSPSLRGSNQTSYDQDLIPESELVTIYNVDDKNFPSERDDTCNRKDSILFDSPKLEFYETNDSIENLEAFLKTEEGLQELVKTPIASDRSWRICTLEDLQEEPGMEGSERKNSDADEGWLPEGSCLSKNNSFEGPSIGDSKFFEKRGKRHPPLSRQNSTEEYNFLEPHDSCLNLSEEISSPSTTPDTSNKTVIFKNKPLTVSNTIDLDDDDFPISESEIQINFNGSETEIVELAVGEISISNERMSNENNLLREEDHLQKSGEAVTSLASFTNNSKEEHQTIHGNETPKSIENDSSPNQMNEEQEHLANVQTDVEVEALIADNGNEAAYNISEGIDIDGKSTLSEEEVEKKFQGLGLAFRTDAMTLQKRLIIRKRLRDQAEFNVEKEINLMKSKLNNLKYLCFDSESLEQLSDMKKHLDIILASVNYLSGTAEAYGFVQNEEKMSGAVTIILRQIETVERLQSEITKSPNLDRVDGKRIQLQSILGDERQEERVIRRRSVAAVASNGPTKRRASIASVPRNSLPSDDLNGSQYGSGSSSFLGRASASVADSCNQSGTPKSISTLASGDQLHMRLRKENRMGDYGMKYVQDYGSSHVIADQSDELPLSSDEEVAIEENNNSRLPALRMSASLESRIRTNSVTSETLNIIDSLRNVVKWNAILIRNSRFQFPENVHQYVSFLTTWYVVILIVTIFTSGFFTGFNRCLNFQMLYSYSVVSCTITFGIGILNMMLRCKPLRDLIKTAALIYACSMYHTLHDGGPAAFFERLGVQVEMYSSHGAPV